MKRKSITGTSAIALMRRLSRDMNQSFVLHHQTFDEKTGISNGMRVVKQCKLRVSLPGDTFHKGTEDLYLPYIDLDAPRNNQNRMCRKKLIRYVAFPPHFELLKVDWFNQAVTLSGVEGQS